MSADPYNRKVRDSFAAPPHAGELAGGIDARVDAGDLRVEFAATLEDGRIAALRFRARGCPHVIAAAEWVCDYYEGKPAEALEVFPIARIMEDLAVPTEKTGRILVLEDAIQSLGRRLKH